MKLCSKKNAAVLGALLTVVSGGSLLHSSRPAHAQPSPVASLPPAPGAPGQLPARPRADYKAPSESVARLGRINDLLSQATPLNRRLKGYKKMLRLPDGTLFIDGRMETDADGSPRYNLIDPDSGQRETSLAYPNKDGDDGWIDSEKVPYIVLPLGFYKDMGIELGDVAAVVWEGKVAYAVFADEGPKHIIGEGSVALSEALGFDPWEERDGRRQIVNGIDEGVLMFVFPHSAISDFSPENIKEKTVAAARQRFRELGGVVD